IFPILQTPFTTDDKLDLPSLTREVRFADRCGAHGVVWPQLASEYATLSEAERIAGAETIVETGKPLHPAIVIGVQAPDAEAASKYDRHAQKIVPDDSIALPPPGKPDADALLAYYQRIGSAASLPLFMQTVGDISVDSVIRISRAVPTLRYIKDEAGVTLPRI